MGGNAILVNFAGGETSPKSRGRFDLPWYTASAKKLLNFISEVTGPARYRTGLKTVRQTRGGGIARAVTFQLNNSPAYELEFTDFYMRVYKDEELLTTAAQTITGITRASPAVLTCAAVTGMANGTEVILKDIVGMPELNGKQVKLANGSGLTFQLKDPVTGANIDTTGYGAYASGGTASPVYEIASPYAVAALPSLQWAQDNTTMYLVCPGYQPRKLTVASDVFTLGTYIRVNDPFSVNAGTLGPDALVDDFSTGDLSKWTTSGTVEVGNTYWSGSTYAGASSYPKGYAFRSPANAVVGDFVGYIQKAQTLAYGTWQILVGSPLSSNCEANPLDTNYLEWRFAMVDATNYYRFKIYGPNANTISLVISIAGVETTLATASINALRGSITGRTFTITRSDAGVFTVYDNGIVVLTITDTTHTTSTIMRLRVGTSGNTTVGDGFGGGATTNAVEWDDLNFYYTHLYQTLCWADDIYVTSLSPVESPIAVAFYEGRLGFFGTNQRPACTFLSRAPDDQGNNRYDDFTGGADADHACFFELAPTSGSVAYLSWARGSPDYLFVGSFGGPFRLSGSGLDIPITPSSINARQFDVAGGEETMAAGCAQLFYIQRGGVTLRTIKVLNPYLAQFECVDLCLNAEQIPQSPLRRVVLQQGRPDALWVTRADGTFCGMTVHITTAAAESIAGWHRHKLGGTSAKVLDMQVLQRSGENDQVWAVTERVIGGVTRRFMEIMTDDVVFPDVEDFFTDDQDGDLARFNNAVYRLQEQYIHLDSAATYNGADRGVAAAATLAPAALTGTVVFTASQSVFKSGDVGSQLWKKPSATTGIGSGRAVITEYLTPTTVRAEIQVDFDAVTAIAAGDWYFAINRVYGLGNLEGERVAVVTDGAVYSDGRTTAYPVVTVSNSSIALEQDQVAAVIHVGHPYTGIIETHNLEMGGRSGPAQDKPRNISTMCIRFLNSLGVEFGTNLYQLEKIEQRNADATMDRPAPVFSGVRKCPYGDSWEQEEGKHVVIVQRLPLPAVIQFIDVAYDTTDEV